MKRKAFTLAEVLIVLGIIGIVAAMTIPTLMNKVAKQEYVTELRKFYSTQMNGWAKLLADEGVDKLEDTSVFQSMGAGYCYTYSAENSDCKPFFDGLKKYFRFYVEKNTYYKKYVLTGERWSYLDASRILVFADGSMMFLGGFHQKANGSDSTRISAGGGHLYSIIGYQIYVDVNGFKKPNMFGRDIFFFVLSGDGKLYPIDGKDYSLFYNDPTWQNNSSSCGTLGSSDVSGIQGWGCAARVMDEGWQMNY